MESLRIAFVCFFPDLGHIIPLFKMARAAKDEGHHVMCYFPETASFLAKRFDVPTTAFPMLDVPVQATLAKLSKRSLFYIAFNGYCQQRLLVDPLVIKSAVSLFPDLIEAVQEFSPDVLVGDIHVLTPMYETVARVSGAAYVQNDPGGTLAFLHGRFTGVYGDTGASPTVMKAVELVGKLFTPAHKCVYYLTHLTALIESRRAKRALATATSSLRSIGPATPKHSIRPGLSWLEIDRLGATDPGTETANLPPLDTPGEPLPAELVEWLGRDTKPAAYISFGSMLSVPDATVKRIANAIRELGYRAIWSTGKYSTPAFAALSRDPDFYIARHLPQSELLKRQRVACFVTHAGAASLAEALIGATPLLCVPLGFDNGYNSWLAERLGVGRRVWKHELGRARFRQALKELISDPAYRGRATNLANRISTAGAPAMYSDYFRLVAQLPSVAS